MFYLLGRLLDSQSLPLAWFHSISFVVDIDLPEAYLVRQFGERKNDACLGGTEGHRMKRYDLGDLAFDSSTSAHIATMRNEIAAHAVSL